MQNVLVDDRRIWVDLYVRNPLQLSLSYLIYTARSPWHGSIPPGPITPKWDCTEKKGVGLAVAKTWKKLDDTGQLEEAIAEMVMEWCSKSHMTEEHHVGVNVIEIVKTLGIGADALSLLCHATDPENGATAEIDILGIIGHAASDRSETEHRACMFLLIVLCVPK